MYVKSGLSLATGSGVRGKRKKLFFRKQKTAIFLWDLTWKNVGLKGGTLCFFFQNLEKIDLKYIHQNMLQVIYNNRFDHKILSLKRNFNTEVVFSWSLAVDGPDPTNSHINYLHYDSIEGF
jgi:hypothetical protein